MSFQDLKREAIIFTTILCTLTGGNALQPTTQQEKEPQQTIEQRLDKSTKCQQEPRMITTRQAFMPGYKQALTTPCTYQLPFKEQKKQLPKTYKI